MYPRRIAGSLRLAPAALVALILSTAAAAAEGDGRAKQIFGDLIPAAPDGWHADKPVFQRAPDGMPAATAIFRQGKDFVMVRFRILAKPRHVDYRQQVETDPHLKSVGAEAIVVGKTAVLFYRAGRRWLALGFATPRVSAAVYVQQPNADDLGSVPIISGVRGLPHPGQVPGKTAPAMRRIGKPA